jgi:ribonuclease H2 subunit C
MVLQATNKELPTDNGKEEDGDADEEDGAKVETKLVELLGEFDELIVWGHGGAVDMSEDVYARGVSEWIGFSEALHGDTDKKAKESM